MPHARKRSSASSDVGDASSKLLGLIWGWFFARGTVRTPCGPENGSQKTPPHSRPHACRSPPGSPVLTWDGCMPMSRPMTSHAAFSIWTLDASYRLPRRICLLKIASTAGLSGRLIDAFGPHADALLRLFGEKHRYGHSVGRGQDHECRGAAGEGLRGTKSRSSAELTIRFAAPFWLSQVLGFRSRGARIETCLVAASPLHNGGGRNEINCFKR